MNELIDKTLLDDELRVDLKNNGFFICGYERLLKVTQKCVDEIKSIDVFNLYRNNIYNADIVIIHGDIDDVVPIEDSIDFCKENSFNLYTINNCDHRYKKDGQIDKVVEIVKNELL